MVDLDKVAEWANAHRIVLGQRRLVLQADQRGRDRAVDQIGIEARLDLVLASSQISVTGRPKYIELKRSIGASRPLRRL